MQVDILTTYSCTWRWRKSHKSPKRAIKRTDNNTKWGQILQTFATLDKVDVLSVVYATKLKFTYINNTETTCFAFDTRW